MKRLLYFFGFLLLLSGVLFLLWWYFSKGGNTGVSLLSLPKNPFGILKDPGTNTSTQTGSIENDQPTTGVGETVVEPLLTKIWDKPVAGFTFFYEQTFGYSTTTSASGTVSTILTKATTTNVLFSERATGHIYKKSLTTGALYKISNSTIAGVHDVYFLNNGSYVVARYLRTDGKTIATLFAQIPNVHENEEAQTLQNVQFLPDNIVSVAVAPSGKTFAYLVKTNAGSTLYSYTIQGGAKLLLTSPLSEWNISFSGDTPIITQKSTAFEKGYSFTPDEIQVAGGKTGFAINPSPNKNSYLASVFSNTGVVTYLQPFHSSNIRLLTLKTLAEKCSWNSTAAFIICATPSFIGSTPFGLPDDWYMGKVSFDDDIYIIGVTVPSERKLGSLTALAKAQIDATHLYLTPDINYLGFINKIDDSLWILRSGDLLLQ